MGQSLGKWGLWVGVFLSSRREREGEGKVAASSSPALRVQGKKKTHSAIQNNTVSSLFFLMNSGLNGVVLDKTHRFI